MLSVIRPDGGERRRVASAPVSMFGLLRAVPGRRDDAMAVINGLFGDTLDERGSPFATPMTIRAGSAVLPLARGRLAPVLAQSVGEVSGRICVLVHGLMSTESIWRYPDAGSTTYGTLLAERHGVTPLTVRYNTGRHVSTNGRELARLLSRLVAVWPVRVREMNLIGHSMGGLVVRSACYYGRTVRSRGRHLPIARPWTSKVRRVVLVGAPNTGAPLEAVVNVVSELLWSLPVPATRLIGSALERRSAGIKDLRFGSIVDEDWLEQDPAARVRPRPHRVHRLRRADHLVVAGTVTADPEHPLARMIGDSLVTSSSAAGIVDAGDRELLPGATSRLFPTVTHIALAHHPDVHAAIDAWWPTVARA